MGPHGDYNIGFELTKLHQQQLRDERAEDRLAPESSKPPKDRYAALAVVRRFLTRVLQALVQRCRPHHKPIASAD
jgi:hypothetical protein